MTQMLISTSSMKPTKGMRLQISVHVEAEVISAETARRQANVWLLMHVGNLLGAENPELVLEEPLTWRVDVILTSPTRGQVGRVGQLYIDAITGDIRASDHLIEQLIANASTFAIS